MAVSSQKGTKPLIVEYVSAALDGEGRLYARQSSAQRLPRMLRAILFGNTHKEVDISGAHYELIRLGAKSMYCLLDHSEMPSLVAFAVTVLPPGRVTLYRMT